MPAPRAHLGSLVQDFERHGRQIALVSPSGLRHRSITYGALAMLARRFAAELEHRGIVKGDRILLWGENGPEWIAAFFGAVLRGVLPVPIDAGSLPDFAARVAHETSPKLIVGSASHSPDICFEDFDRTVTRIVADAIEDLNENDPLQIIFTSGTTGEPKGIVHTHKNVLASLRPIEAEMGKHLKYERIVHPIRILHTLPLSHVFGQFMGLWIPSLLTAEVHFESRLVAPELVSRIRTQRISVLAAVPRVLDLLRQHLRDRVPSLAGRMSPGQKFSALKKWWHYRDIHRLLGLKFWAFVCGGASLTPDSEQFWHALGFVVVQGYGMTETTALVSLNHPFRAARGTVGQVLPGREVRLNEDGEVLVRGETISNSTWQQGRLQQADSEWLATGDLAEFDEAGNLRFRGRKKDVIVTAAGLNIHPEDLEAALARQPGVKAATVIESATERGPEALAVLVLRGDIGSVIAAANNELADFQQIRRWLVWPEPDLPRTPTGKVLRREVARRIASGEIKGESADTALNLDSLGRVQLQAELEAQYGVSLDDSALQTIRTSEDIHRLVQAGPAAPSVQHVYPYWPWNPLMQAVRGTFLELIALPLLRLLAKPHIETQVTQWPSSPVLIVANHVTSYDVPFILKALPGRMRRRVAVAMSGEMILDWRLARNQGHWFLNFLAPFEYWLVTGLFNIFPLPQRSGFRRSFQHAGEAIDRGYSVIVFPEGHRSKSEAAQPFKTGAGLLWKELGTPALPVRLRGLGAIKAGGGRWFRTGTISVSTGPILQLDSTQSPEQLTEILRLAIVG